MNERKTPALKGLGNGRKNQHDRKQTLELIKN